MEQQLITFQFLALREDRAKSIHLNLVLITQQTPLKMSHSILTSENFGISTNQGKNYLLQASPKGTIKKDNNWFSRRFSKLKQRIWKETSTLA